MARLPGYVGYEQGGVLTEAVRRRPYQVILFDEVEKAHSDIFNIMLQILDEGRLTDSQGITVDFKNTIIILTSNIGAEILINQKEGDDDDKIKEQVMEYVRVIFKPEFLNRLDEIIMFHKLSRHNIHDIVKIQLEHLKEILAKQNIILSVEKSAINYLADKGYDPMFGARPLKRLIQREIQNNFARLILSGEVQNGNIVNITSNDKELIIKKA